MPANVLMDPIETRFSRLQPLILWTTYFQRWWSLLAILAVLAVIASTTRGDAYGLPILVVAAGVAVGFGGLAQLARNVSIWFAVLSLLLCLLVLAGLGLGLRIVGDAVDIADNVRAQAPLLANAVFGLALIAYAFLVYFAWVWFRGTWAMLRATPQERAIMRETKGGFSFLSNLAHQIWGLPPLFEFARRPRGRYVAIVILSLLAAVFCSLATIVAVGLLPRSIDMIGADLHIACGYLGETQARCMSDRLSYALFGQVAIGAAAIALLLVFGWAAQRLVQRLVRFSLEDLQRVDPRPPVLFLRAFGDDQVELNAPTLTLFGRLLELGQERTNLDRLLLEEATPYGPVVGLGNPDDRRPPYGAARGYFNGKTWQDAVADLARNSEAIVICLDDTDGIWWEVEHLAANQHLSKTLFLMHPGHLRRDANAALLAKTSSMLRLDPQISKQLLAATGATSTRSPGTVIGYYLDPTAGMRIVTSSTFSRFAYLLIIRLFLREKLGPTSRPLPSYVSPQ